MNYSVERLSGPHVSKQISTCTTAAGFVVKCERTEQLRIESWILDDD